MVVIIDDCEKDGVWTNMNMDQGPWSMFVLHSIGIDGRWVDVLHPDGWYGSRPHFESFEFQKTE